MKSRKGFTLVELLAVIAILAIIVIIALPNVMGMFNSAKEKAFLTEVKNIYKTAESTWMSESMFDTQERVYSSCKSGCSNPLSLSGRKEIEYYVKVNKSGQIVELYVTDGTYQFQHNGDLLLTNITGVEKVADIENENDILSINGNGKTNGETVTTKRVCIYTGHSGCSPVIHGSYTKETVEVPSNQTVGEFINNQRAILINRDSEYESIPNCSRNVYINDEQAYNEFLNSIVKDESEGCYDLTYMWLC